MFRSLVANRTERRRRGDHTWGRGTDQEKGATEQKKRVAVPEEGSRWSTREAREESEKVIFGRCGGNLIDTTQTRTPTHPAKTRTYPDY